MYIGVRAVKQQLCWTADELRSFLQILCPNLPASEFRCVVKPVESAGTDDVFLCSSVEEAENAFQRIVGKVRDIFLYQKEFMGIALKILSCAP